ncbi:unnamed protein product [Symbiodinium sp. KB8]|nr:unnamed protein product [Symbiodinium sp. KB8]
MKRGFKGCHKGKGKGGKGSGGRRFFQKRKGRANLADDCLDAWQAEGIFHRSAFDSDLNGVGLGMHKRDDFESDRAGYSLISIQTRRLSSQEETPKNLVFVPDDEWLIDDVNIELSRVHKKTRQVKYEPKPGQTPTDAYAIGVPGHQTQNDYGVLQGQRR